MDSRLVSEASKFHFISNYRADSIQALIRMIFIFIIIANIIHDLGEAKLYNFDSASGNLDSNWKSNTLSKWNPVLDECHPHNNFLTTELSEGERCLSTEVDGDGLSTLTFDWKKIGEYSELIFYFDDKTDKNNITACNYHNGLGPVRPITIPLGHHIATWDFKVSRPSSGNGIACSQAWLDNINIPEPKYYPPDCTMNTLNQIVLGQESVASVPFAGQGADYDWQISNGGIIKSQKPYANRIIWKSINLGRIKLEVSVRNESGFNSGSIERIVSEREKIPITSDMDLDEIIRKSENKILVLEDGNYSDEIKINVRNLGIVSKNPFGARFVMRGSNYGIVIDNTSNVSIENICLKDCECGIIIYNSTNCSIYKNNITYKNFTGVFVENSSYNNITNNFLQSEANGKTQAIRLQNSTYNIIYNNSIASSHYIYAFNSNSIHNAIKHNFKKFSGLIFNLDDETICHVDCTGENKHKLKCDDHPENRKTCAECISCDKIGGSNIWICI